MEIHISARSQGDTEIVTATLSGSEMDFVNFIDEGSGLYGILGVLTSKVAKETGLVAERADNVAIAAMLLRQAANLLDREPR